MAILLLGRMQPYPASPLFFVSLFSAMILPLALLAPEALDSLLSLRHVRHSPLLGLFPLSSLCLDCYSYFSMPSSFSLILLSWWGRSPGLALPSSLASLTLFQSTNYHFTCYTLILLLSFSSHRVWAPRVQKCLSFLFTSVPSAIQGTR